MTIDFGKTSQDYSRYRAGFPDSFFRRLTTFNIGQTGQQVLDLATGTGTLARGLALRGCHVIGIDIAPAQLAAARRLDATAGVAIEYRIAPAEDTGLPAASIDVVTAGQCWHWFDRPRAAQEGQRLLRPGGTLLIAHFDWLPLPGNVVEATERLILQHNPAWLGAGGDGLHTAWFRDVSEAGFNDIESFTYDEPVVYSHEAWRGRIRASAGVAASLSPDQVTRFDADLTRLLDSRFPEDPLKIPHRVFALMCKTPQTFAHSLIF